MIPEKLHLVWIGSRGSTSVARRAGRRRVRERAAPRRSESPGGGRTAPADAGGIGVSGRPHHGGQGLRVRQGLDLVADLRRRLAPADWPADPPDSSTPHVRRVGHRGRSWGRSGPDGVWSSARRSFPSLAGSPFRGRCANSSTRSSRVVHGPVDRGSSGRRIRRTIAVGSLPAPPSVPEPARGARTPFRHPDGWHIRNAGRLRRSATGTPDELGPAEPQVGPELREEGVEITLLEGRRQRDVLAVGRRHPPG